MSGRKPSPAFVALVQATAGATGGTFAAFCLMPFEVAKTRIAVGKSGGASTFGTIELILRTEGLAGLFQGVAAKCCETGTKNFIYFYIYDAINTAVKGHMEITTVVKLALGYAAGVVNTLLTMPLEVLATRSQMASAGGGGTLALINNILAKEGIGALFTGLWFNILLCINPAIQNTSFDKMKARLLRKSASLTAQQAFVLGALAKALATCVTYPLVRIKTILQAGEASDAQDTQSAAERERPGHALVRQLAQLYTGIGSALWKSVLQAALLYMTKDQVEGYVVRLFKLSAVMLRRRSGAVKLGAFSGRPLAS